MKSTRDMAVLIYQISKNLIVEEAPTGELLLNTATNKKTVMVAPESKMFTKKQQKNTLVLFTQAYKNLELLKTIWNHIELKESFSMKEIEKQICASTDGEMSYYGLDCLNWHTVGGNGQSYEVLKRKNKNVAIFYSSYFEAKPEMLSDTALLFTNAEDVLAVLIEIQNAVDFGDFAENREYLVKRMSEVFAQHKN